MVLKYKSSCPTCFSQTGQSIVMEEKDGIYTCPKNKSHKFTKDEEGFWKRC